MRYVIAILLLCGGAMIVKTFDGHNINDGTNYRAYVTVMSGAYGLPALEPRLSRVGSDGRGPLVGGSTRPGHQIALHIDILDYDNWETLYNQLMGWLDVTTPVQLVVTDSDGSSNQRYIECLPKRVAPWPDLGSELSYLISLQISGDLKWRSSSLSSDSWSITATGQTKVVTNDGTADAYPILTLEATSSTASGYAYKQWVPFRWRADEGATGYPVELSDGGLDTAALVTAGKAQYNGDDFRVEVDGVEVNRWFGSDIHNFDTIATYVWVNLDFDADIAMTLKTAIASSGTVDTIELNEVLTDLPSVGTVVIDSEAFTYTSKSDVDKTLNNVTRAQKGTSMAAHSVDDDVYWIQNDIWYLYGNASATAPTIDDEKEPILNLGESTNIRWMFNDFGENDGLRSASWTQSTLVGTPKFYTYDHGEIGDPWEETGIKIYPKHPHRGQWQIINPCGITAANFTNGEHKATKISQWHYIGDAPGIYSSTNGNTWVMEYAISAPSSDDTWDSWAQNETLAAGSIGVALRLFTPQAPSVHTEESDTFHIEASDIAITLDSSNTPTPAFTPSEQNNYAFLPVIANNTTGESIELNINTGVNLEIEIDTYEKTVEDENGVNLYSGLTVLGDPRAEWLRLQPGSNTLQYDDAETGNVTMTIEWRERHR